MATVRVPRLRLLRPMGSGSDSEDDFATVAPVRVPGVVRRRRRIEESSSDDEDTPSQRQVRPRREVRVPDRYHERFEPSEPFEVADADPTDESMDPVDQIAYEAAQDDVSRYHAARAQHTETRVQQHDRRASSLSARLENCITTRSREYRMTPDLWRELMSYTRGLGRGKDVNAGVLASLLLRYNDQVLDDEEQEEELRLLGEKYRDAVTQGLINHAQERDFPEATLQQLSSQILFVVLSIEDLRQLSEAVMACNKLWSQEREEARLARQWQREG
jgi:hypothetical protein